MSRSTCCHLFQLLDVAMTARSDVVDKYTTAVVYSVRVPPPCSLAAVLQHVDFCGYPKHCSNVMKIHKDVLYIQNKGKYPFSWKHDFSNYTKSNDLKCKYATKVKAEFSSVEPEVYYQDVKKWTILFSYIECVAIIFEFFFLVIWVFMNFIQIVLEYFVVKFYYSDLAKPLVSALISYFLLKTYSW